MILRPILQPVVRPLAVPFGHARRPTDLTISQLLPSGAGRVAAIYSDPAKPSYDECIQKNMAAIAAGRPQDCVLFADAAGQTPVLYPIGAGQGKGLLLDRSAGLVRGPELVAPVDFQTGGWTSVAGGLGTAPTAITTSATGGLRKDIFTIGKWYEIDLTITATGTSCGVFNHTTAAGQVVINVAAGETKTVTGFKLLADKVSAYFRLSAAGSIVVSQFSVREIPGHHQQQPTAAARGEFSRRYNQLLATEDFGNAFWIKTGVTVDQNTGDTLDPNGLNRAVKILPDTGTSAHKVTGNVVLSDTTTRTYSIYLKSAGARYVRIARGTTSTPAAVFDLVDVVSLGSSSSITDVGDGWRLCQLDGGSGGTSGGFAVSIQNSYTASAEDSYTGDGISGIYAWHPDLRFTADAIPSIPAYQRVTTASDYDEVGFPTYWRAQTDDWAKSHMNPNGATKAYVFWAGQKMSDAAEGVLVELGASILSNNGVFVLRGPHTAGLPDFAFYSKGTSSRGARNNSLLATIRVTAVGHGDITGGVCSLTANGTTTTYIADQGTGTYTEQDVFFGARGGGSLFANIREYAPPLILFLQPADSLSASHLSKLQRGYAKAVGVTL